MVLSATEFSTRAGCNRACREALQNATHDVTRAIATSFALLPARPAASHSPLAPKPPLPSPFQASNASPSNPRLPADVLLRAGFLDFLDVTADTTMRRCHHCAQATFVSLQEGFGPEGGAIVKALTPLPGIAERGETSAR
ncbi:MAG: hypothetical protein BWX48_02527 [Verrucomicrobia bacterium ADurb.Bin006]|nr:MAG: hypothetical protein BWX48_02527 [Verrucomicrobia bacterium ADurb.Bin006]